MAPVYSTRFGGVLVAAGSGQQPLYRVPAGSRAVIKCVTSTVGSLGPAEAVYLIDSFAWLLEAVPANTTVIRSELTVVVNEGEELSILVTGADCATTISGFLLSP